MKFQDRISEYPGRIKLTDENGEAHYYTLERADEPTQPGTPLSAENLNKLTQDVNGKTGASIVLTGDDIAISASDSTTVKERVDNVRSAASERGTLAQEALNNQQEVVLWENDSPSSSFYPETFPISDNYKYIVVLFNRTTAQEDGFIVLTAVNGNTYVVNGIANGKIVERNVNVTMRSITITRGLIQNSYGSFTELNDVLIPIKIIGILK